MNSKIAALVLGALTTVVSAGPIAPASKADSVLIPRQSTENSTAPGEFHKLVSGPSSLATADITHLYVCIDINFGGSCRNLDTTRQACSKLDKLTGSFVSDDFINGFDNTISSLGPDPGTNCEIWDGLGCRGDSISGIVYPGISDLRDYNFNDRTSSYLCN
ncbi:MAG: hypothetical protein LQ352_003775 [Teloschistes flavicans]|nr:MAG: hypothetical protein LQ352_003775 [Teloschistes flavicans]